MAYCTASDVNVFLGGSLGAEQLAAADALVEGASDVIDRYTGTAWSASGDVVGEVLTVYAEQVRLVRAPVTSVTSVTVVEPYIGAVPELLVDGNGYQLLDPSRGLVLIAASDGAVATVDYTPTAGTVPDDVIVATTMLVAHWLQSAIDPSGVVLTKLEAGTARLSYRKYSESMPASIAEILDGIGRSPAPGQSGGAGFVFA